jgi:TolB-like protein
VRTSLDVLAALGALHRRGVLHRDLKPSNIFLTEHGAKLLDFGVARTAIDEQHTLAALTGAGNVIGTLRYMAPEQAAGGNIDARADLFALGTIIFEMLSGRPAFTGDTPVRLLHAVMYEQPPVLTGSAMIAAVDRVVHRALSKQPGGRPPSAEHFAAELRAAGADTTTADMAPARPLSRLIVLPFRLLRSDPEIDFLGFSLADAVTHALSGLGSLVVRSSVIAAKLGADADLTTTAREADVDVVLTGTLLRAGDQLRVTAQLAEVPAGAILWSQVMQVSLGDIFQLQDTLVQKLLDALSITLTAREHRMLGRDIPATPKAYEFYLRANEEAKDPAGWEVAIDLYRQCLAQDPNYAPAWGRLGYLHRLMAKYRRESVDAHRARAVEAFTRALALNPDLAIAHKVLAQLDVEGGRATEAMTRLLRLAGHSADPEIFGGLCHVLRYCGLLEASIAAHEQAARLDPKAATSVMHTFYMLKNFELVIANGPEGTPFVTALALAELGRRDEALALLRTAEPKLAPRMREFTAMARILIRGEREGDFEAVHGVLETFQDPEGLFYAVQTLARLDEREAAVRGMARAVAGGYFCYPTFATDPWLDNLRGDPRFEATMQQAKERHEAARAAFNAAGGPAIVGTSATAL